MPQEQDQNSQVPAAISTTPPIQTKTTSSESPLKSIIQAQQSVHAAAEHTAMLQQKYSSIDSMNRADKITALKNTSLNPYHLSNPYDGLANSLHRWKTVAGDAVLSHYTDEQKLKVASNYYAKMLAPIYTGYKIVDKDGQVTAVKVGKGLGIAPMSKELWLKQAYKEGVDYKIEDSYNNSIVHSLSHGWNEGLPSLARAGQFVYNVLGNAVEDAMGQFQKEREWRKGSDQQRTQTLAKPWHVQAAELHNQIASVKHDSALDKAVNTGAQRQTEQHEFWASALPNYDGWLNHATSFVAEQAAQLPMYAVMGEGSGVAKGSNLTAKLFATNAGKRVFGYLMAGTEGLAYGVATRPQEDKTQAWKDALGFTIFHGMFDVTGMGTKKLGDVVSGAVKDALDRRETALTLAKEGNRPANAVERYEDHKTEVGNNLVVAGVTGQRAIYIKALHHIQEIEDSGLDRKAIKEHELKMMNEDPAEHGPMLSSAAYVRSLLSAIGKRLTDIKLDSEEYKFIASRLAQLIVDSGSSLNTHVKGLANEAGENVAKEAKTPGTARTLQFYKAKVVAELGKDPAAAKMVKPEQIEKMAQAKMAADQTKAATVAERELTRNPVKEATSIALREKPAVSETEPALKVRSQRTTDRFGQPAVSYSVNADYKVQLKKYSVEAKTQGKTLAQFFEGMSDEDFKDELSKHFYPKELQKAGIYFEGQQTREGKQSPNFLAFMYNYLQQMPKEFGKELEARLIDTMKVQSYMKGRRPTEPQLAYYAKAMYNHMDNFLGSGRWPQEANIFRSTQEDLWHSTVWQEELLEEKEAQESKNLRSMFSGNPKAKRAASTAYKMLAEQRRLEYAKGPKDMKSQERISELDENIADLQTSTGEHERWVF